MYKLNAGVYQQTLWSPCSVRWKPGHQADECGVQIHICELLSCGRGQVGECVRVEKGPDLQLSNSYIKGVGGEKQDGAQ